MCRQSKRCNAKMTAITTFVILFTFTFTYASVFPSRHSKNTAMMDNPRNFVSMSFEALASIAQSFSEWIALLASYCLTVSCCLLESFSVVLVTVWENTVVILSNLRMFILMIFETLASIRYWENICAMIQNIYWFIAKIFEALENVAHVCLKCIALLASYCHTVSSYLLEWLLFVLIRVWDNMVVILDNLRKFTSMIVETLTGIGYWENTCAILESLRWLISTIFEASIRFAHGCLEWIRFLASHCHTASCYLLELFSVVLVRVWDNMVVILDNLRKFTLMIVQTLTSIKYWENTCNVLENLRWLISKIFEASSSFAQVCFEWFTLIASYCHTASCYLLDLSLVILIRVWNNMVIILDDLCKLTSIIVETLTSIRYWENSCIILESLRWLISKIFEVSNSFARVCFELLALIASYCHTASCYLLELFSVILIRAWNSVVIILDNLRMFTSMIIETLTSIKYWENTSSILESLQWLISTIFEASSKFARGCLEWIYVLAPYFHTVSCYLSKWFSKGAINLMIHWKNSALLFKVLCGTAMIWRCYFRAVAQAGCESTLYRWQFKEADSYWWENFGPSDDVTLEKLYCDVNNLEVLLKLTDTALSASSSQVKVNFEEMSMHSPTSAQFLLRRWSTPSFVQEPNNKSSTQWVWYWKDNDGWKKYAETMQPSRDIQGEIEAAYLNEEDTFSFRSDSHNYILKFYETPMYQMNINPDIQTMRKVSRRPVFVSKPTYQTKKSYPRGMVVDFERNCLENESEEYRRVSRLFHETMPEHQAYIVMVEKIWNEELLERYQRKRERIKKKLEAKRHDQIEKLLFHGTSSDVVDAICKENFDHRLRGKHATKYGEGSYFARDASYSNNYSSLSGEKTRFMFLAFVLTGEYKLGGQDFRRPPLKDPNNPASDLYDSCVDDEYQPTIFVIFNDEQCYPSYLIKYELS